MRKGNHETRVLKCAVTSRCLLLTLILVWRAFLAPYDTSALLNPQCLLHGENPPPHLPSWHRIGSAIQNSVVWDSVYFVRIAECGYEYEQSYAFLPLLPLSIKLLSRTVFAPLVPLIGYRAVLALSGYAISNAAFVFAALYLYRLSVAILKDSDTALRASILFCFNPASIFYLSIYSESLYSLFSIGGLYHLISGADNIAVLCFGLSGCARSNGLLNAGYFCFQTMHQLYDALFLKRRAFLTVQVLVVGALRCVYIFAPFVAFQAYGYSNICLGHSPGERSPWCEAKIPLLYNYIQSHYWGVGFLRYFQLKQLPNFLLASPMLSLAVSSIIHYVRSEPEVFCSLGFQAPKGQKRVVASFAGVDMVPRSGSAPLKEDMADKGSHNIRWRKHFNEEHDHVDLPTEYDSLERPRYLNAIIIPCILHLGFMATTAFFVMHVQVATRFLSASPPLYWFASYIMVSRTYKNCGYMIWAYCAAYILLGSLLFSNFYPFT